MSKKLHEAFVGWSRLGARNQCFFVKELDIGDCYDTIKFDVIPNGFRKISGASERDFVMFSLSGIFKKQENDIFSDGDLWYNVQ